jgi:acyl-coenzyme A synthetase/AMP-(fatty) acid ligase
MNIAHLLVQQATLHPTDDAIIEGPAGDSRRISFADLADRTARAAALLRKAGVRRGDHVLLFIPMSIELYVAMIAISRHSRSSRSQTSHAA